uniref:Uncharacterized protein n=1 Tax=Pyxicephalus adspersus TaxID=30357 RepID=A0AAV2ZV36_PYXAD|nr:TPA: hypothetical protein GDO54_017325 [Pyxicephalus adspersus]
MTSSLVVLRMSDVCKICCKCQMICVWPLCLYESSTLYTYHLSIALSICHIIYLIICLGLAYSYLSYILSIYCLSSIQPYTYLYVLFLLTHLLLTYCHLPFAFIEYPFRIE